MTRTPMPSPRGTNFQKLYVSNMAHDARLRGRRARDAGSGGGPDDVQLGKNVLGMGDGADDLREIVTELQGLFRAGLADEDVTRADQLLEQLLGFCGNGEAEDDTPDGGPHTRQPDMAPSRASDQRRFRSPSAADLAGGGLGLDKRWAPGGVDERATSRAEAEFQRRFGCGPPPRSY
jgi:hypothetical protein